MISNLSPWMSNIALISSNVATVASTETVSGGVLLNATTAQFTHSPNDIMLGDISLKNWIASVNQRLLILEPKKELLEQYEALRLAYEHYQTLEKLLTNASKKS